MKPHRHLLLATGAAILATIAPSCIATAPVSIAWRSNASQQYATTEGKTDIQEGSPAVNADKTTEASAAVTTSGGNASTK